MNSRSKRILLATLGVGALTAGPLVLVPTVASGSTAHPLVHSLKLAGHGSAAAPRSVDVSALPNYSAPAGAKATRDVSALRMNGTNRSPSTPAPSRPKSLAGSPNSQLVTTPIHIKQNFAGTDLSQSSCSCQPPDSNGAIGGKYIVEADNLSLQTWTKAGNPGSLLRRVSIASFLGTSETLTDPRVFYDDGWNRWVFFITVVPASSSSTPQIWFAASKTANPDGAWWVYDFMLSGGDYPAGTLLDYPMIGMSSDAILGSTNNYIPNGGGGMTYFHTAVWALSKERAYNGGQGMGFAAWGVEFSTHPAFVEGIPQGLDSPVYLVASLIPYGLPGFDVYSMSEAGLPNETVSYLGTASDPAGYSNAPPRAAQPGSSVTLDALDGRLQAAPHQLNGMLWFARAVMYNNNSVFPTVQYGVINPANLSVQQAKAFASGSSYDWNPSIGVRANPSGGGQYVYLNWAFTDPSNGVATSMRVSGLGPADAVQDLSAGTTLVNSHDTSDTGFGDYSSVSVTPVATDKSALVVNETFDSSGNWQDWIGRVSF